MQIGRLLKEGSLRSGAHCSYTRAMENYHNRAYVVFSKQEAEAINKSIRECIELESSERDEG